MILKYTLFCIVGFLGFLKLNSTVYWMTKNKRPKYLVLGSGAWKKPFAYRVAHHGYLLTCCLGQKKTLFSVSEKKLL